MVEVTKSNFEFVFPLVEKSIKNSSFIAIDSEFTGLYLGATNNNNLFDSLPERYEKLRARATSFIPCQIGLSTFTRDINNNSYLVETFVFYVRPSMIGNIDRVFGFQASSIDFLCLFNFDFKKFLTEGIPYINENEALQVLQKLNDESISVPHEKLRDQRDMLKVNEIIDKKFRKRIYKAPKAKASNEKVTIPINPRIHVYFQLKEIRRKFPKLWAYSENNQIVVCRPPYGSRSSSKLLQHEANEKKMVLEYFLGFTRVFKLLKDSKKPIVGHNLLMDLMLFYQNFHQDLPDSYEEFKKKLHQVFPVVYDTKHIWLNIKQILKHKKINFDSNLTALYEVFKNPPDYLRTLFSPSIIPINCKQYVDEDLVHDSGYDAFMTGYVFLKICHILATENPNLLIPQDKPPTFKHLLSAASLFVNKVNFPYFRIKYMNLKGADPPSVETNYLYVSYKDRTKDLSLDEFNTFLRKYELPKFEFKKLGKAAVVATQSARFSNLLLKDFKDNRKLVVEKYNFLRHSPYVSATFWLTTVASGCLAAALIWKYRANICLEIY